MSGVEISGVEMSGLNCRGLNCLGLKCPIPEGVGQVIPGEANCGKRRKSSDGLIRPINILVHKER